jgi:hypothetical protein
LQVLMRNGVRRIGVKKNAWEEEEKVGL